MRVCLFCLLFVVLVRPGLCEEADTSSEADETGQLPTPPPLTGLSAEEVERAMGEPMARVTRDPCVMWSYTNCIVVIQNGEVTSTHAVPKFEPITSTNSACFIGKVPLVFGDIPISPENKTRRNMMVSLVYSPAEWYSVTGRFRTELAKYPQALLDRTLQAVFVPARLSVTGDSIGGTCDSANWSVYVTFAPRFHHEFAHLLYSRFRELFPADSWNAQNGEPYTKDGRFVRLNWDEQKALGTPWYHERGFINRYAMVSEEEDFCALMEATMVHPEVVGRAAREFPRLRGKLDIQLQFLDDLSVLLANAPQGMPIRAALQK